MNLSGTNAVFAADATQTPGGTERVTVPNPLADSTRHPSVEGNSTPTISSGVTVRGGRPAVRVRRIGTE